MKFRLLRKNTDVAKQVTSDLKPQKSKNRARLLLFALLIIIVALAALFLRKHLPNVQNAQKSCENNIALIEEYNTTIRTLGVTNLPPITKKVLAKEDYLNSPTCTYMLMIGQYGTNSKEAPGTYKKLKEFEGQGKKVSDKINDGIDRAELEKLLQRQIDEVDNRQSGGDG